VSWRVSAKSAIVIPAGAVNVVVPVAPIGTRAPAPTALPIVALPGQDSSALMPVAPTLFHDRLS
jgi:hypothetical protein